VAEEILVGRCMAAKGVPYPAPPPKADQRTDEERSLRIEERRRTGYGLATPAGTGVPALDRYVKGLPRQEREAFTRALFGEESQRRGIDLPGSGPVSFPSQGCVYEAQSKLFGDILTWARVTYVPEDLNNKLSKGITNSDVYAQAMRKWRECMKRRGYDYELPAKAQEDLSERYKKNGVSEQLLREEIAVAVADAECAREVGIPQLVLSLKKSNVATLTDAERRSLRELSGKWLQAATAAQTITVGR
jgi:hypothetical protein